MYPFGAWGGVYGLCVWPSTDAWVPGAAIVAVGGRPLGVGTDEVLPGREVTPPLGSPKRGKVYCLASATRIRRYLRWPRGAVAGALSLRYMCGRCWNRREDRSAADHPMFPVKHRLVSAGEAPNVFPDDEFGRVPRVAGASQRFSFLLALTAGKLLNVGRERRCHERNLGVAAVQLRSSDRRHGVRVGGGSFA